MPISSGALEWPVSYYNKPEKETVEGSDDGQGTPRANGKTQRAVPPQSYKWQPQLSNREDYEKWRKKMDRKEPLKTKKKKREGCFPCWSSNKINTENEDPTKGEQRDSPRETIKRRRRRCCCLLAFIVSLLAFLLLFAFVFVFLRFTGHESLGPGDLVECTGQWRSHFLAYADHSNKTNTVYYCCYLPNLDNVTVWTTLSKSGWPDGYLYSDQSKCNTGARCSNCEDCKQQGYFAQFASVVGDTPCAAIMVGKHSYYVLVFVSFLIGILLK